MSEALQRGSVVLRGEHYGVVWTAGRHQLVVLPVTRATKRGRGAYRRAHDVELSFAELLAAAIALPEAFIEAGAPVEVDCEGQALAGALVGPVLCRVVHAVVRAHVDATLNARWEAERRHRGEARSVRGVNLIG